jgi:undecaprenyl phosphate-alpha-L-ara4N flippase subunit ArnF
MRAPVFILILALITLVGDYFLKLASQREQPYLTAVFVLGALAYGATALGWVIVMQHMTLAAIGVWYSIIVILLLAALGVFVFEETLTAREILGLVLACVSLALMSRFA